MLIGVICSDIFDCLRVVHLTSDYYEFYTLVMSFLSRYYLLFLIIIISTAIDSPSNIDTIGNPGIPV